MLDKDKKEIVDESLKEFIGATDLTEHSDELNLPAKEESKYTKIKNKAENKAKKTLNTLLRFYLSEEIIEQEDYVNAKTELEKMTLTKLIYLMETGEKAITTLMEQIDNNNMSPRMFEVLGTLQKSLLDVIKAQTTYMMATEESVKRLSRDVDIYSKKGYDKKQKKATEVEADVFSGTKHLMQAIQDEINDETDENKDD